VPAALIGPTVTPTLLVGCDPCQPSDPVPPLAVQALAPLVTQVNKIDWPVSVELGVASKETIDAAGAALVTVTVAVLV
jgi:hypothetical protein